MLISRSILSIPPISFFSSWSKQPGSRKSLRKGPIKRPTTQRSSPEITLSPPGLDKNMRTSKSEYVIEAEKSGKKPSQALLSFLGSFENCPICNTPFNHLRNPLASKKNHLLISNVSSSSPQEDQLKEKGIPLTPKQITSYLNEYVIGQDEVKKSLAVAVSNHFARISTTNKKSGFIYEKSNILLLGPSGSGKTLLVKTLAKALKVPVAICDATTFTQAGYVGDDVESMIYRLLQECNFNIKEAETGIIFLDEVDKISKRQSFSSQRDVGGEGVQQALLKMLEGTIVTITEKNSRRASHNGKESYIVDTSNILFVLSGAFQGIDKIINSRTNLKKLGFADIAESNEVPSQNTHMQTRYDLVNEFVEETDLIEYGFIPEFVGRIPIISVLQPLSKEALLVALAQPKNSLLRQFDSLFNFFNVTVTFTQDSLNEIVEIAFKKGTGARGLRSILEKIIAPIMFEIPRSNISKVIIDSDVVKGLKPAVLILSSNGTSISTINFNTKNSVQYHPESPAL